jgi:hypothetical protein
VGHVTPQANGSCQPVGVWSPILEDGALVDKVLYSLDRLWFE